MAGKSRSADIHRQLNYPGIDADGHWIEFEPTRLEYLNGVAGPTMVDRFRRKDYLAGTGSSSRMTIAERAPAALRHFFDALVQRHAIGFPRSKTSDLQRRLMWLAREVRLMNLAINGGATVRYSCPVVSTGSLAVKGHTCKIMKAFSILVLCGADGIGDVGPTTRLGQISSGRFARAPASLSWQLSVRKFPFRVFSSPMLPPTNVRAIGTESINRGAKSHEQLLHH